MDARSAHTLLARIAHGPAPGDVDHALRLGLDALLDEQLAPPEGDDPDCARLIADATLRIEHDGAEPNAEQEGEPDPPVAEDRPLRTLGAHAHDLWHLSDWSRARAWPERVRPRDEVLAATFIRAVHARFQLREILADFWHNHFNVSTAADHVGIAASWPAYDRDVIRRHALGNFRDFLEAVASSPAMLLYLNNASSRASPANENYARELFELHTLGSPRYLNHLYNRWREVPGAPEGNPAGYIDQDVYEAARAFTGWTIEDGQWMGQGQHLPRTGRFRYVDAWHDPYQKRVLGFEIDPNQGPLADGRRVLDLVADHPGTADHLCRKLVRRLIADDPPDEIVRAAADTWSDHRRSPDQIARVVRVILSHPAAASTPPAKAKRPLEYVASLMRALGAQARPTHDLWWLVTAMGQRVFSWPTPAGHPDLSAAWSGAGAMLMRWNAAFHIAGGNAPFARVALARATPEPALASARSLAAFWAQRLLGPDAPDALIALASRVIAGSDAPDAKPPADELAMLERLRRAVALLAISPPFQHR